MVDAKVRNISDIFEGNRRYEIPFFQRKYIWQEKNWEDLWGGLMSFYQDGNKEEYFIGNILVKDINPYVSPRIYEVIDGQQRLITISILLKALEDLCQDNEDKDTKTAIGLMLRSESDEDRCPRLECSMLDKDCFSCVIMGEGFEDVSFECNRKYKSHPIYECYNFFRNKIKEYIASPASDVANGKEALLGIVSSIYFDEKSNKGALSFVRISLGEGEDEQGIFSALNSTGKNLTLSELVKNYIFREKYFKSNDEAIGSYEKFWEDVFEGDEDDLEWWNKFVTRGRNQRCNLDVFLYCFLVIQVKHTSITMDKLFLEYKNLIDSCHKSNKIKVLLEEFKEYAQIYRDFFLNENEIDSLEYEDWQQKLFLTINMFGTTSYPLILYFLHENREETERAKFAEEICSFLFRRMICGLTSRNYNLLFPLVVYHMAEDNFTFSQAIQKYEEQEARRFPGDDEFMANLYTNNSLNKKNWTMVLYFIALKQMNNAMGDIKELGLKLNLEYIMPDNWRETRWYSRGMNMEEVEEYNSIINTIGNLTLANKKLKKAERDVLWEEKKKHLRDKSILPMTASYLNEEVWNKKAIKQRAFDLGKIALDVWPNIIK